MIKDYKELETIYTTRDSRVFIAKKYSDSSRNETDELLYAIKEYYDECSFVEKNDSEKKISQNIENTSHISVVIPVLESISGKYLVMQYKKNGLFLRQIIDHYKNTNTKMKMEVFVVLVRKMLSSLGVLHNCYRGFGDRKGYLHMDLHPGNIFVENFGDYEGTNRLEQVNVKFIDFQNSLMLNAKGVAQRGNNNYHYCDIYSAPEVYNLNNLYFEESTDLFSVATIIKELFALADCNYNSVSKAISDVIEMGVSGSACYRYQHVEDIMDAINSSFDLYNAFIKNKYILISDKAYYMNVYLDVLLEDAKVQSEKIDVDKYNSSVDALSDRLLTDRPDVKKCKYIFDYLYTLYKFNGENLDENKLIYVGMSAYNNAGCTKDAAKLAHIFFEKRDRGDFSLLEYSRIINRVSENYYDLGDIEGAILLQQQNIGLLENVVSKYMLLVEKEGFSVEKEELVQSYAKAYSALGRYLYVRSSYSSKIEGIYELEKALLLFGKREWDRKLSINHILSIAVEQNDKGLCEKYVGKYFGKMSKNIIDLDSFFDGFIDDKNYSYWNNYTDYELLLALKIINAFCLRLINEDNLNDFLNTLVKIVNGLNDRKSVSYPVNLIYKYIGLIIYNINDNIYSEDVAFIMEKACNCDDSIIIRNDRQLNILGVMTYQTKWLINSMKKDDSANQELLKRFLSHSSDEINGLECFFVKAKKLNSLEKILRLT